MFGILLLASGAFFSEIGVSLGKEEVARRKENIYSYGFLSLCLSTLAFIGIAFARGSFLFRLARSEMENSDFTFRPSEDETKGLIPRGSAAG